MSFPERGKWALEATPTLVQVKGTGSPRALTAMPAQGHKG